MGILDKIKEKKENDDLILKEINIIEESHKKEQILSTLNRDIYNYFYKKIVENINRGGSPTQDLVFYYLFPNLAKFNNSYFDSLRNAFELAKYNPKFSNEVQYLSPLFDGSIPYCSTRVNIMTKKINFFEKKYFGVFTLEKIPNIISDLFSKITDHFKREDIHIEFVHGIKIDKIDSIQSNWKHEPDKIMFQGTLYNNVPTYKDNTYLQYYYPPFEQDLIYMFHGKNSVSFSGKLFFNDLDTPFILDKEEFAPYSGLYSIIKSFIALKCSIFIEQR
jgi:hypothetical protein